MDACTAPLLQGASHPWRASASPSPFLAASGREGGMLRALHLPLLPKPAASKAGGSMQSMRGGGTGTPTPAQSSRYF